MLCLFLYCFLVGYSSIWGSNATVWRHLWTGQSSLFGPPIYNETPMPRKFTQLPGYSVGSFARYVCFDGVGNLEEWVTGVELILLRLPIKEPNTICSVGMGVFTGIFTIQDPSANPPDFINHYFVMADDWDELRFIILDTYLRQPVTSGTMRKIDKK